MTPPAPFTPSGILETVIYSRDLDAARRFYEESLGLELVSSEPGRHLFFRLGTSMLLIFNPASTLTHVVRVGPSTIPTHGAHGASHFAFAIEHEQLDPIRDQLARQGIEIESEILWPGGGKSIYCRDPDGHSVEFATRSLWFR